MRGACKTNPLPERQADATLSQANPVSATRYTVLDTTANVRIYSIVGKITWATTQPTPLTIYVTIDGHTFIFSQVDPVSATDYGIMVIESAVVGAQGMVAAGTHAPYRSFILEGRSVKVEIEITWAVTQPTPLVCLVKYAKW